MSIPVNASIVEHFQTLEDPRIERTKKHNLLDILVIALCTLLTGGEGCQDMALFGKSKRAWLQTFLALPHGIPSHDTFGRVFARLNPQRFQECFLSWTQAVAQLTQGTLISLDGKTLRASPSNVHPVLDFLGHDFRSRDVVTVFVCRSLCWFLLGTARMLLVTS